MNGRVAVVVEVEAVEVDVDPGDVDVVDAMWWPWWVGWPEVSVPVFQDRAVSGIITPASMDDASMRMWLALSNVVRGGWTGLPAAEDGEPLGRSGQSQDLTDVDAAGVADAARVEAV